MEVERSLPNKFLQSSRGRNSLNDDCICQFHVIDQGCEGPVEDAHLVELHCARWCKCFRDGSRNKPSASPVAPALCEFHETERATLVLATELADEHEVLYDTNELLQLTEACAPLRYRTSSSCNLAICSRIIFASAQSSVGPAPWF